MRFFIYEIQEIEIEQLCPSARIKFTLILYIAAASVRVLKTYIRKVSNVLGF